MKTQIKVCINDQYTSRTLSHCDRATFQEALAMALREFETEIMLGYERISKNSGGGN